MAAKINGNRVFHKRTIIFYFYSERQVFYMAGPRRLSRSVESSAMAAIRWHEERKKKSGIPVESRRIPRRVARESEAAGVAGGQLKSQVRSAIQAETRRRRQPWLSRFKCRRGNPGGAEGSRLDPR